MNIKNLEYCSSEDFAGTSVFIKDIKNLIKTLCTNTASILLQGEKGTGKAMFARAVHFEAGNKAANFLEVNCRAVEEDKIKLLFEKLSDLSSSDAVRKTIYFSNIECLSIELQGEQVALMKLLRENQKNIRFVFSTQCNLDEYINDGRFLSDLYFQISTVPVNMVSLRQRKEDIIAIGQFYVDLLNRQTGLQFKGFSDSAKKEMEEYFWAGNVAELRNAVERSFITGQPPFIGSADLALMKVGVKGLCDVQINDDSANQTLKDAVDSFKKSYITKVLEANNWNQTKTARVLGIQRTYVIRLINELQIRK